MKIYNKYAIKVLVDIVCYWNFKKKIKYFNNYLNYKMKNYYLKKNY